MAFQTQQALLFHQQLVTPPQLESPLVQQDGRMSIQWVPFFTRLWQSTQPHAVTLTAANAPIDPSTGQNSYTVGSPNITLYCDVPAPLLIHLTSFSNIGWFVRIKDISGSANVNTITVLSSTGPIDGQNPFPIAVANGSVQIEWNGNSWSTF